MSRLWTPHTELENLFLWLDGKDTSGFGTVPTNGTEVDVWQDKSRNRLKFIKDGSHGLPTYQTSLNGLDFDGTETLECLASGQVDDFLVNDSGVGEYHVYIVGQVDDVSDSGDALVSLDATDGTGDDLLFVESTGSAVQASVRGTPSGGSETVLAHGTTVAQGTVAIFEGFYSKPSNTTTGIDGLGVNVNGGTRSISDLTVNGDADSGIKLMNKASSDDLTHGSLKEVLIFKESHTVAKSQIIQGYLAHKYGVTASLPSDHPYKTEAPLVTNPFNGAHKLNPREPIQVVKMYLDECDNIYGVNSGLSTCNISNPDNANACHNTKHTCVNLSAYRLNNVGVKELVFSSEKGRTLSGRELFAHPALISVSSAPTEIKPTKGLSVRSNIQIKIRDFFSTDKDQDPYFLDRNIISLENGTYFQKLIERNPHYYGRRIEVYDGFFNFDGTLEIEDGKRSYIIDSISLDKDVCTIKCKDPLSLADDLKAKVPEPTRFSLGETLNTSTHNHINLKFDDIALDGSVSADKTKVTDYFGADNATGFIRINEEIMGYRVDVSGSEAALDITSRNDWGTQGNTEAYDAGDSIQKCIAFGTYQNSASGSTIGDVAYQLLVTEAGVPASAINNATGGVYSWTDEGTTWLNTFKINTVISEPTEANKLVSELGTMVGVNFFYDDVSAQIVMKAEMPELNTANLVTIDDSVIVEDSLKMINSEKDRISRVYYYYKQKNMVEDRDKKKSFSNLYVNIDADSEGEQEYNKQANKVIYGWGVSDATTATSISQRILNRFKNIPKTVSFKLDVSSNLLSTGDHFFLNTKMIRTLIGGIQPLTEMQVTSTKYNEKEQCYEIKAKQFRFSSLNIGEVSSNVFSITAAGSGYAANDSIDTFSGGSNGATSVTVKVLSVNGSGGVTGIELTNIGQLNTASKFAVGDVLTENDTDISGSGLQLTIGRLYFIAEGGGTGTEADPYTGARADNSYICDHTDNQMSDGSEPYRIV